MQMKQRDDYKSACTLQYHAHIVFFVSSQISSVVHKEQNNEAYGYMYDGNKSRAMRHRLA